MKYIITILISLMLSTSLAFAHGGGHAKIKESQVIEYSDKNIASIVRQQIEIEGKKLDKSWLNISKSNKKIYKKGEGYYITTFKNDTNNKTLYILLSEAGELYDANYSGKFEGL
ncbi:MAG: hypothetical protein HOM46_00470 [Nitrosomonadales bacterium]|jgi:hypothetical protein|nr:hypothetical protein [Nitrosomonadales bacterium]